MRLLRRRSGQVGQSVREELGLPLSQRLRGLQTDLLACLLLALASWWAPSWALHFARPALLNLGPNDEEYVRGFRSGWERLGITRFHWTSRSASVHLPLKIRGDGHVVRMRIRRHFVEPAYVRLTVEGRTVGAPFTIKADTRTAYFTVQLPLPPLEGKAPFALVIDAPSENPAPLGIALDWLEIEASGPLATFHPLASTRWALALVVISSFSFLRLSFASRTLSLAWAGLVLVAGGVGAVWDVIAAERILREGAPAYIAVALGGLVLVRSRRARQALGIEPAAAGFLCAAVLIAIAVRLTLVLHPQFYYPDVKVHALFVLQLARRGLAAFLRDFTLNQFRYSLGLQMEHGHWYAFPYPPAFYILCWPLVRFLGLRPEVAVSVTAAALNSLEVLVVYGIARGLKLARTASLAASFVCPVLPLFLARLTLAYFPALVGHAMDALVVLFLVTHMHMLARPRVILCLGGLLAVATLFYTQGLLNFAVLLPLFFILQWMFDRTPDGRARRRGLLLAGLLGASLSLVLFYGRYLPVFLDMQRGVPMPEERVLLDKFEREGRRQSDDSEAGPRSPQDPFTGNNIDLFRGVRKAGWRFYVFYGGFAPFALMGLALLLREGTRQGAHAETRFIVAWALTYLVLNLASGGLPGPNLVRYNKDLEIVAPLCCLALGTAGVWLWTRVRALGLAFGIGFWLFGISRAARYLTQTFVLER